MSALIMHKQVAAKRVGVESFLIAIEVDKPVSYCSEFVLRVYYEYLRVITRKKVTILQLFY